MKSVVVKLFGPLRQDMGTDRIELKGPVSTLLDLIDQLVTCCGKTIKEELLDQEDQLDHSYAVFVDGERVSDLSVPVADGAEVVITSMLAGG